MKKQDIDSILLANWYFTKCKLESPVSDRTELARKYLVTKVGKALTDRVTLSKISDKVFFMFILFSIL